MVAWDNVEDDLLQPARRARSASDFCVKYEYLRGQRKASDDDKVTPLASPQAHKDDYMLGLQDRAICEEDGQSWRLYITTLSREDLDAVTPDTLPRVNTYEHDLASPEQAASEQWQGNAYFPCYPGVAWMPAASAELQHMPSLQYVPQQAMASPALVYYCVGYLAPEAGDQMMQAETSIADASYDSGSQRQGSATTSPRNAASDVRQGQSQSSQKRSARPKEPQPKVLEAGEVRRDDMQGSTEPDNFAIYGYAFVNFVSHEQASKARQLFDGFVDWHSTDTWSQKTMREPSAMRLRSSKGERDSTLRGPLGPSFAGLRCARRAIQDRAGRQLRFSLDAAWQSLPDARNSPVMSSQVPEMCRPLVFSDGQPVSFPAPTILHLQLRA
eukprot:s2032_g1.t1